MTSSNFKKIKYTGNDTFWTEIILYDQTNTKDAKDVYSFDANKNLVNHKRYQFSMVDTFREYTNYHYEDYFVSTNLQNHTQIKEISLYPNPAGNIAYLSFFSEGSENIKVSIADITGKSIFTISEISFTGDHLIQIPTAQLNPGIYYVSIYTTTGAINTMKLVISE